MRFALTTVFCLAVASVVLAAAPSTRPAGGASSQPTTGTANVVPEDVIRKIDEVTQAPGAQPKTREEAIEMLRPRAKEVVKLVLEAEEKYPAASNLYEVQLRGLQAGEFLVKIANDKEAKAQVMAIAGRLSKSPAPEPMRAHADYLLADYTAHEAADNKKPQEAEKIITDFVSKYAATPLALEVKMMGTQIAVQTKLDAVAERYLSDLKTKLDDPKVMGFLAEIGRLDGVKFQAQMTRLDGTKLTLPDDLLGKVVVVDFWATWCQPCVMALPHMKELYAKYKGKDVAFVGVSLDNARGDLEQFVKSQDIAWPIVFSGKGWQDPTAVKHGITSIPAVWVIGRDGAVFSTKTRNDEAKTIAEAFTPLEGKIDEALKQPTSQPATEAGSKSTTRQAASKPASGE